ncbi:thioesterase family protein [Paraferrimonas sp. SM1919]|uniref:acyl-CoA thioesterase n=1 Tax=Paraferrimonas sp. SM1919 TaxID=2662263 RepID=UPI0013D61C68|nr:thioesterase family protein [Paraferrimonas sp. SM1919]
MKRSKLQPLAKYRFYFKTHVRITDLNYANHLGHDTMVTLLHEAKAQMFKALDVSDNDLGDGKTGYVMADLQMNYLHESFAFDELEIYSDIEEISNRSFRIFQAIYKDSNLIALGESGCVSFDFEKRQAVAIPTNFINKLANY